MAYTKEQVIKKRLTGEVVSISGTNTIKVRVESRYAHPIYEKILKKNKSFMADIDLAKEKIEVGDVVTIESVKPISKRKTWKFIEKVK